MDATFLQLISLIVTLSNQNKALQEEVSALKAQVHENEQP